MDSINHKEFYDHFMSQGCACLLMEKVGAFKEGTYIEGLLYAPGSLFNNRNNVQIHDLQGKIIEFKNERQTCETTGAPLYFNKRENRFMDLSDEYVAFDRTLFETEYACRKGSVILYDVFLSSMFKGCVLISPNWM